MFKKIWFYVAKHFRGLILKSVCRLLTSEAQSIFQSGLFHQVVRILLLLGLLTLLLPLPLLVVSPLLAAVLVLHSPSVSFVIVVDVDMVALYELSVLGKPTEP